MMTFKRKFTVCVGTTITTTTFKKLTSYSVSLIPNIKFIKTTNLGLSFSFLCFFITFWWIK